jgi:hypothetical protein
MDSQQWLSLINTLGFPLVAIYGYIRGYVISPRERDAIVEQYHDLKSRYDKLELEVKEERAAMRGELAETRSMLFSILIGDAKMAAPKPGGD